MYRSFGRCSLIAYNRFELWSKLKQAIQSMNCAQNIKIIKWFIRNFGLYGVHCTYAQCESSNTLLLAYMFEFDGDLHRKCTGSVFTIETGQILFAWSVPIRVVIVIIIVVAHFSKSNIKLFCTGNQTK